MRGPGRYGRGLSTGHRYIVTSSEPIDSIAIVVNTYDLALLDSVETWIGEPRRGQLKTSPMKII